MPLIRVYMAAVKQPRFAFLSAHLRCVGGVTRLTRESSGRAPRRILAVCYSESGTPVRVAMTSASPPFPLARPAHFFFTAHGRFADVALSKDQFSVSAVGHQARLVVKLFSHPPQKVRRPRDTGDVFVAVGESPQKTLVRSNTTGVRVSIALTLPCWCQTALLLA